MKLGSFVGQGSVSMVNEEMQFCRETINNAIKSNDFGFLEFEVSEVENSKTYDEESMFELKLTFQKQKKLELPVFGGITTEISNYLTEKPILGDSLLW